MPASQRHCRGHGRGESGPDWLRDNYVSRKQPVRDYRRRDEDGGDAPALGRSDCQLQLARADVDRSGSEAGYRRARQSGHFTARSRVHAGRRLPAECCGSFVVYPWSFLRYPRVFHAERHQHGDAGGKRRRGHSSSGGTEPVARHAESAVDEDRVEDIPTHQHGGRSDNRRGLHRHLRHLHGWRRVPGYRSGSAKQGWHVWSRTIAFRTMECPAGRGPVSQVAGRSVGQQHVEPEQCMGPAERGFHDGGQLGGVGHLRSLGQFCCLGDIGSLGHIGRLGNLRGMGYFCGVGDIRGLGDQCQRRRRAIASGTQSSRAGR